MNCPALGIEKVREEFNDIINALGGKALSKDEAKDKDIRSLRKDASEKKGPGSQEFIDYYSMEVAYAFWDNTNGDGLYESSYYRNSKYPEMEVRGQSVARILDAVSKALGLKPRTTKVKSIINPYDKHIKARLAKLDPNRSFSKLPQKGQTRTMTYAGIGSRETPDEVKKLMTVAARRLAALGYKLNTGFTFLDKDTKTDREGADEAFVKGASRYTEFGPNYKRGEIENKSYSKRDAFVTHDVVYEIHPYPKGLFKTKIDKHGQEYQADGGFKLMARNTHQVFGENLDTPVDFVLYWAKEDSNKIRPDGGTGQAVEMARLKGVIAINMALPDWADQLKIVLDAQKTWPMATKGEHAKESALVRSDGDYTRKSVEKDIDRLYVFTDNTNRSSGKGAIDDDSRYSKKYGKGLKHPTTTSATIRGLDNAMPVSTQRYYDPEGGLVRDTGRWVDEDIEEFKTVIDAEFQDILDEWNTGKYISIVFPSGNGLFNGRISQISKERTPELYKYLQGKVVWLKNAVDGVENNNPINVYSGEKNAYSSLSNPANRAFTYKGTSYDSVERAYQHAKLDYGLPIEEQPESAQEALNDPKTNIFTLIKAMRSFEFRDYNEWDAIKLSILEDIMLESFRQNQEARNLLLSTGNRPFTHISTTGANLGEWSTLFPNLLNSVRKQIASEFAKQFAKNISKYPGKIVYATPGSGKTTLAQKYPDVFIDTDDLMEEEILKMHPNFKREDGETIQQYIYRYTKSDWADKAKINENVLARARELAKEGKTVLTGTLALINEVDEIILVNPANQYVTGRFGSLESAESYSRRELLAIGNRAYAQSDDLQSVLLQSQEPGVPKAESVYNLLGDKTEAHGVQIKGVYQRKGVEYAKRIGGVFSMRVDDMEFHFGNPFSSVEKEIKKGLIRAESTKDAVIKYIDWVLNSPDERAAWIRERLDSGELKGKTVIYYMERNEPSHATALAYMINNWESIKGDSSQTNIDGTEYGSEPLGFLNPNLFPNKKRPIDYDTMVEVDELDMLLLSSSTGIGMYAAKYVIIEHRMNLARNGDTYVGAIPTKEEAAEIMKTKSIPRVQPFRDERYYDRLSSVFTPDYMLSTIIKSGIKKVDNKYYFVISDDVERRINKYLSRIPLPRRNVLAIGISKTGFKIAEDDKKIIHFKIDEDGRSLLYVNMLKKEIIEDSEGYKFIRRIPYYSFSIEADLVTRKSEKDYLNENLNPRSVINHEVSKLVLKGGPAHVKVVSNFMHMLFMKNLVKAINKKVDGSFTTKDFMYMDEQSIYDFVAKLGLDKEYDELLKKTISDLGKMTSNQTRDSIVQEAANIGFDVNQLEDLSNILDALPDEFMRLVLFSSDKPGTGYFTDDESRAAKGKGHIVPSYIRNLFNSLRSLETAGFRLSIKKALADGVLSKDTVDRANNILSKYAKMYVLGGRSTLYTTGDGHFSISMLMKNIAKSKEYEVEDLDGISAIRSIINLIYRTPADSDGNTFKELADVAIYEDISERDNLGLINFLAYIGKDLFNAVGNVVGTDVVFSNFRDLDADRMQYLLDKGLVLDNVAVVAHEIGHAVDLYITSVNYQFRESLNHIFNAITLGSSIPGNDAVTIIAKSLRRKFNDYIEKGFLPRGYKTNNIKEILADLFATVLFKAAGVSTQNTHLESMEKFLDENSKELDRLAYLVFKESEETDASVQLYKSGKEIIFRVPNEKEAEISKSVGKIVSPDKEISTNDNYFVHKLNSGVSFLTSLFRGILLNFIQFVHNTTGISLYSPKIDKSVDINSIFKVDPAQNHVVYDTNNIKIKDAVIPAIYRPVPFISLLIREIKNKDTYDIGNTARSATQRNFELVNPTLYEKPSDPLYQLESRNNELYSKEGSEEDIKISLFSRIFKYSKTRSASAFASRVADRLSALTGVEFEIISRERASELGMRADAKGMYVRSENKAYLVEGVFNAGTAFHEVFGHPFLNLLKSHPELVGVYNTLAEEVSRDKSIMETIAKLYKGSSDEVLVEEAINYMLTKAIEDLVYRGTVWGAVRHYFKAVADFLNNLYGKAFGLEIVRPRASIQAIADFMYHGKGRLMLEHGDSRVSMQESADKIKGMFNTKEYRKYSNGVISFGEMMELSNTSINEDLAFEFASDPAMSDEFIIGRIYSDLSEADFVNGRVYDANGNVVATFNSRRSSDKNAIYISKPEVPGDKSGFNTLVRSIINSLDGNRDTTVYFELTDDLKSFIDGNEFFIPGAFAFTNIDGVEHAWITGNVIDKANDKLFQIGNPIKRPTPRRNERLEREFLAKIKNALDNAINRITQLPDPSSIDIANLRSARQKFNDADYIKGTLDLLYSARQILPAQYKKIQELVIITSQMGSAEWNTYMENRMSSEIMYLQKEVIPMYKILYDELNSIVNHNAYNWLAGTKGDDFMNALRKDMKDMMEDINSLSDAARVMIRNINAYMVQQARKNAGLDPMDSNVSHFDFDIFDDSDSFSVSVLSTDVMQNETLRVMDKMLADADIAINGRVSSSKALRKVMQAWSEIRKNTRGATFKGFLEVDSRGKRTGYLISDLLRGKFIRDFIAFKEELANKYMLTAENPVPEDKEELRKYLNEIERWKSKYSVRKFKQEYYDAYNKMSPAAQDELYQSKRNLNDFLMPFRNADGTINTIKMSKDQYRAYLERLKELSDLSLTIEPNGLLKVGESLKIAQEIKQFRETVREGMEFEPNWDAFNKAKDEVMNDPNLTQDQKDEWSKRNTVDRYIDEFYDRLKALSTANQTSNYEKLYDLVNDIIRTYRDPDTGFADVERMKQVQGYIGGKSIPMDEYLREVILALDNLRVKGAPNESDSFDDFAENEFSPYFLEAEARMNYTTDPAEKKRIMDELYYTTKNGTLVPYRYHTRVKPKDEKYILRNQPNMIWSTISDSSQLLNPDFDDTQAERGMIPNRQYYDNSAEYNKLMSNPLYANFWNSFKEAMDEANSLYRYDQTPHPYRLAQIDEQTKAKLFRGDHFGAGVVESFKDAFRWKDYELVRNSKRNNKVRADGSRINYIRTMYRELLQDGDLITSDMLGALEKYYRAAVSFDEKSKIDGDLNVMTEKLKMSIAKKHPGRKLGKSRRKSIDELSPEEQDLFTYADVQRQFTRAARRAEFMLETRLYGQTFDDSLTFDVKLNERKKTIKNPITGKEHTIDLVHEVDLGTINLSKPFNALKRYMTTLFLAKNVYVIFANMATAFIQAQSDALSGVWLRNGGFYSGMIEVIKTFKDVIAESRGYITDNKTLAIMRYAGIARSTESTMSRNYGLSIARKLGSNFMFAEYTAGDFFVKGAVAVGVMKNVKFHEGKWMNFPEFVEYETNKAKNNPNYPKLNTRDLDIVFQGIEENLFDSIRVKDGKLYVDSKEKSVDFDAGFKKAALIAEMAARKADGALSPKDRSVFHQHVLGQYMLMFRGWMLIAGEDRFGKERFSYRYNSNVSGNLRGRQLIMNSSTLGKFLFDNITALATLRFNKMKSISREAENLSINGYYNVKKTMSDMTMITAGLIASILAKTFLVDEDDDKKTSWGMFIYTMILRIFMETSATYSALEAMDMIESPIAGESTLRNLSEAPFAAITGEYDEIISGGRYKYKTKGQKALIEMTPIVRNLYRQIFAPDYSAMDRYMTDNLAISPDVVTRAAKKVSESLGMTTKVNKLNKEEVRNDYTQMMIYANKLIEGPLGGARRLGFVMSESTKTRMKDNERLKSDLRKSMESIKDDIWENDVAYTRKELDEILEEKFMNLTRRVDKNGNESAYTVKYKRRY